jgi:predicted anti-sigma-YlaC factor YlaD
LPRRRLIPSRRERMKSDRELTCRELVELVTEYLEGGLTLEERMRFEEHLLSCDGCSAYLDQMRHTIEVIGVLEEKSIPPGMRDRLLHSFRAWRAGGPPDGAECA